MESSCYGSEYVILLMTVRCRGQNIGLHEDCPCTALSTGLHCPQLPLLWQISSNEVDLFDAS